MNKIKKFIAKFAYKIKGFSILGYMLDKKVKGIIKTIGLKRDEIKTNQEWLAEAQDSVPLLIKVISDLGDGIKELENRIKDINRIK